MSSWKAFRISDVIRDIDEEKYVLPVIQRHFIWEEEKIELLFDTLLKGDSFGGIMVIDEEKGSKPLFIYRHFTKDGGFVKSAPVERVPKSQYFVIDGQQRLQSFYIGLLGNLNGKVLYFDLFSNFQYEFEFKFENDFLDLPVKVRDMTSRTIDIHAWISVNDLLQKLKLTNDNDQTVEEIIAEKSITDNIHKMHVQKNVAAFFRNVFVSECVGVSIVQVNKKYNETSNRQKIVELFKRLNDGGTRLSLFDLAASILKGFDWRMEGFLEETLSTFNDIGLNQDDLIKLIFIFQDNHKKEMMDIDQSDTDFAIINKDRIKKVLAGLKKFLQVSVLYDFFKEGNRSFIPLFFIAYHLFHKDISNDDVEKYFDNFDTGNVDFPKIYRWAYYSLLNGIFRSRGAGWIPYTTGIKKILDKIKGFKTKEFPVEELFKVYEEYGLVFSLEINDTNLNAFDPAFVYYLIYNRKQVIRIQDEDHIHPKNILEKMKIEWRLINNIGNYQLIDSSTNRWEKNGMSFKTWIKKDVKDIPSYLKQHLISEKEEYWDECNFPDFLTDRREKILTKLKDYCK